MDISLLGGMDFGGCHVFTQSIGTPGACNANTTLEHALTITDPLALEILDHMVATDLAKVLVLCNKPTYQAGMVVTGCRIKDANEIYVQYMNTTAGNITPTASEVYVFALIWPNTV